MYPADKHVVYAHFLIAVIYFEQISDEKKDIDPLLKANDKINFFLEKYPNTDYAIDLRFKKDLIENQLAAVSKAITCMLSLVFVIFSIRSFIKARKAAPTPETR